MSPAASTPSIRIYDSAPVHRYPIPHHRRPSFPSPSGAMAIPRAREDVPPPLPPPRHLNGLSEGQDPGWQWGNTGFGGPRIPIKEGSSLLGGTVHVPTPFHSRKSSHSQSFDDASPPDSDEDYLPSGISKPRLKIENYRLTSERQLGQKSLQSSSHAYDKQLLSKIGGPNTPNTPTRTTAPPLLSVSAQDPPSSQNTPFTKLNGQLKPLSVPDRLGPSIDSPVSRWPPSSGATSPMYSGYRSPVPDSASIESHQRRFGSISTSGTLEDMSASSHAHRGSYDHGMFSETDFSMEESGMRDLDINDRLGSEEYQGSKAGLKRRASSPPSEAAREDRPTTAGGKTDLYHRRSAQMLVSRNSPVSRFQGNQGSLSSASSLSQRTASFASSYGFSQASSMTSYSGDQRLSPSALSPSAEAELGTVLPYAASRSLNPSPRGSLSRPHHQRGPSEHEQHLQIRKMSTDSILQSRPISNSNRIPGAYICECCPKKPKKFDSEDELRIHELEKQYTCQYCPNRFKNKNEAERHQNSLHLRRHSWSCAALAGPHAAFHPSPSHSAAADVCGYCGEEFPNPPNWDVRSEHLNHVHKFGECNQAKKFFRADHFRQHLKHSHAGTSGKWTNMLENACMKDEPPPKERVGSIGSMVGSSAVASLAPKPNVIDEVLDES
ncbi:hypothetical protein B0J11DRAFT_434070 [Dendryphion nanum]|uniref:C2H2-type domain-containing protein n=1 Tax=Dendryphion nanum TaxID=256645 RepID=A0A9P9DU66_9PLEO|nr:hypothetical protein B0J11DRAFT_434070 [Dendryphion nanum]